MAHPVPLQSFLGGLSIPIPVHALTLLNGNVFGISGFIHRAVKGNVEGAAGAVGLVLGGMLPRLPLPLPLSRIALSGLLVGLGTKLSNGCTSGSLAATVSFFTTGVITASLLHSDLPAVGTFDWTLGASGAKYLAYQAFPLAASALLYFLAPQSSSATPPAPASKEPTLTPQPSGYQPLLRTLAFVTTSVQFALALQLSGLTDPTRVLSFLLLPFHKAFDPSLAFLAAGALPLGIALYRYARGNEIPRLGGKWSIPKPGSIDTKLVLGAAIFGVGWGMAGVCPGPGLVNLGRAIAAGGDILPFATFLATLITGGLLV
ncbi:hypothetical protein DFP72DRAFT_1136997 [Ephemerocybe angulata]|uniref:Sulphur transport domain-containing protein n=1 Tax=Ephemerocybe angulata TaxID=980116 RepID=A0A8H6IE99_9AGAR|nr:hypothetical protein DFP72DRAFT_1136997 [Tulosesus angulatus]